VLPDRPGCALFLVLLAISPPTSASIALHDRVSVIATLLVACGAPLQALWRSPSSAASRLPIIPRWRRARWPHRAIYTLEIWRTLRRDGALLRPQIRAVLARARPAQVPHAI
jgi:hypothetical protein